MNAKRPSILDELGIELVRAARAEQAGERRRRAARRLPRVVLVALASMLLLAAVAVAATIVIGRGDPIPPPSPGAVPRELQPVAGTARLNGLDVPDPDGGPGWDVRTSRSQTGATCAMVGQVLDGELGIVGLDRRFRALPPGAADTCSTPQRTGATLAGARAFRGGGAFSAITVVNGVAGASVTEATVIGAGRSERLRLGPDRAFLAIFKGTPEEVRPRIVLTASDGVATTLRFADTGEYLTPDPTGGAPWSVRRETWRVSSDVRCVQAERQRGPDSPQPLPVGFAPFPMPASAPIRCGLRSSAFLDVQRLVPRDQRAGYGSWWGFTPARTIAWGAVPRADARVVLESPGQRRPLSVDPATHGFAVVFDGRLDPRTVRISVDGHQLAPMENVTDRRGRPVPARTTPPPAWRSLESVLAASRRDPWLVDRSSVKDVVRADDPSGGESWVLRIARARIPLSQEVDPTTGRDLHCFQVGHARPGGRLVLPRAGGGERELGLGEDDLMCNDVRWLREHPAGAVTRIEVDDPRAPDPEPQRVVVSGALGDGIASADLIGAGPARPLRLGPHGTFLLILEGDEALQPLRVRQTRRDGTTRTSFSTLSAPACRVRPGHAVQVADPDGGAPWVLGSSPPCTSFVGRLIDGAVATIAPDGTLAASPEMWAEDAESRFRSPRRPLSLTVDTPAGLMMHGPAGEPAPDRTRRTLVGRTLVHGRAAGDIVAVTLRTPRDIRTLRPVGGLFLAVFDGAFYGGEVRATGHRADGSTVSVSEQLGRR